MNLKVKKNKGITLVALVVTIIVLMVLAGITLSLILGQNGIIRKAQEAKDLSTNDQHATDEGLNNLYNEMIAKTNGTTLKVSDLRNGEILSNTDNTKIFDDNNNTVTVPAGFKIASSSATSVTDGIVVEDGSNNEFVWIPVGTIHTATGDKKITLSRYTFGSDGTPTDQGANTINAYYKELASSTYGNATAKNLSDFLTKVASTGGYYIGRYEGRQNGSKLTENVMDNVWNGMTQQDASTACRNMFASDKYTSDLANSYAWDTSIVYEEMFGGNSNYANKTTVNSSFLATGTSNQSIKDVICNIYDMASNYLEWTTETSEEGSYPCVVRGGNCTYSNYVPMIRCFYNTSDKIALRPILYL